MIEIASQAESKTTLQLTPDEGKDIRELLESHIDSRITAYCLEIGMNYTNIANMLSGRRKISINTLNRLFSKTNFVVECGLTLTIRKDPSLDVNNVDSTNLDDIFFFEEEEDAQEEP